MVTNSKLQNSVFKDPSLWFLLVVNLITFFVAIHEDWNVLTIIWIYLLQSITIGFFNFLRILQLKNFSTNGFYINGQPALPTEKTKITTAFFFLCHYGLFHLVYIGFLTAGMFFGLYGSILDGMGLTVFIAGIFFVCNHLFSYYYNRPKDTKLLNIGALMFYPYARIIPMHIFIILGFYFTNALLIFLILKTVADCLMHVIEHELRRN